MTKIDLKMPCGWNELTDYELKYVFQLFTTEMPFAMIASRCFIHWSGMTLLGKSQGNYIFELGDDFFELSPLTLAEHLSALDWLRELPHMPVRPSVMRKCNAVAADFKGVSFETYMIADNLYQGYLATKSDALLGQLAAVLYPGFTGEAEPWQRIAVFYWVAALKGFFSRRYADFFQPAESDSNMLGSSAPNVEEAMNAQIRALTKGDVTKEGEILALDCWRALTELNAQAREYKELNAKLKTR
ncbi:MAG: hypothetical protein NC301_07420 [Bacteroides sp.]|nr:hypothetical protein [Bacteroides sp.]MCM1380004.1 hypothetical protein [Bacteroides sp.]MCM1446316.1 hypothetical protein [Prevotella sp.]